jgi:hypothetical protein
MVAQALRPSALLLALLVALVVPVVSAVLEVSIWVPPVALEVLVVWAATAVMVLLPQVRLPAWLVVLVVPVVSAVLAAPVARVLPALLAWVVKVVPRAMAEMV